MKTNLLYYEDPYLKELKTRITAINQTPDGKYNIQLEATIFYPEGGGQPGDKGTIIGAGGTATLLGETGKDEKLLHKCTVEGTLKENDEVTLKLDWDWRYKYMKIHTAGHLIHDILVTLPEGKNLKPIKGGHGSKAFIEYSGDIAEPLVVSKVELEKVKEKLEHEVVAAIKKNLTVVTGPGNVEELRSKGAFIPPNLPTHKPIRYIQIGDFTPMPDGGVQLKSVGEIGNVRITSLQSSNNLTKVTYQVIG